MNNEQAEDCLMIIYQSEGEKIGSDACDYKLLSALDCAFGAFQTLEEAIVKCKEELLEKEVDKLPPYLRKESDVCYINHLFAYRKGIKTILEILERGKDE